MKLGSIDEITHMQIKKHPVFQGLDWDALLRKEIQPPWIPSLASETDTAYFHNKYTHADVEDSPATVR